MPRSFEQSMAQMFSEKVRKPKVTKIPKAKKVKAVVVPPADPAFVAAVRASFTPAKAPKAERRTYTIDEKLAAAAKSDVARRALERLQKPFSLANMTWRPTLPIVELEKTDEKTKAAYAEEKNSKTHGACILYNVTEVHTPEQAAARQKERDEVNVRAKARELEMAHAN